MNDTKAFEYNYSADRAKEIEAIRKKYEDPKTDKFEQLKALVIDKPEVLHGLVLNPFGRALTLLTPQLQEISR